MYTHKVITKSKTKELEYYVEYRYSPYQSNLIIDRLDIFVNDKSILSGISKKNLDKVRSIMENELDRILEKRSGDFHEDYELSKQDSF